MDAHFTFHMRHALQSVIADLLVLTGTNQVIGCEDLVYAPVK